MVRQYNGVALADSNSVVAAPSALVAPLVAAAVVAASSAGLWSQKLSLESPIVAVGHHYH